MRKATRDSSAAPVANLNLSLGNAVAGASQGRHTINSARSSSCAVGLLFYARKIDIRETLATRLVPRAPSTLNIYTLARAPRMFLAAPFPAQCRSTPARANPSNYPNQRREPPPPTSSSSRAASASAPSMPTPIIKKSLRSLERAKRNRCRGRRSRLASALTKWARCHRLNS